MNRGVDKLPHLLIADPATLPHASASWISATLSVRKPVVISAIEPETWLQANESHSHCQHGTDSGKDLATPRKSGGSEDYLR